MVLDTVELNCTNLGEASCQILSPSTLSTSTAKPSLVTEPARPADQALETAAGLCHPLLRIQTLRKRQTNLLDLTPVHAVQDKGFIVI